MAATSRDPGSGRRSESASVAHHADALDPVHLVIGNLPFAAVFLPDGPSAPSENAEARRVLASVSITDSGALATAVEASRDRLLATGPTSWEVTLSGVERRRLRVTASPFRDRSNRRLGALLTILDVTTDRETTDMHRSFVSTIAHELRTPLAATRGFIDNLLDGIEGPVTTGQRESLERMARMSDRLLSLLDGLLRLAKLQSGMAPCRVEPTDLAAVIGESVIPFQRDASKKGVRIATLVSASLPPSESDGDRIVQVITNLLSNAIKHTPRGGEISIRAAALRESTKRALERLGKIVGPLPLEGHVQISVEDSGDGISADEIDRIFDPFHQSESERSDESGVGLGLAICKEILRGLQGHMLVESRLGKGSCFTVVLPNALQGSEGGVTPTASPSDATNEENTHARRG